MGLGRVIYFFPSILGFYWGKNGKKGNKNAENLCKAFLHAFYSVLSIF